MSAKDRLRVLDRAAATHLGACKGLSADDKQNIWALFNALRDDVATLYRRLEEESAAVSGLQLEVEAQRKVIDAEFPEVSNG